MKKNIFSFVSVLLLAVACNGSNDGKGSSCDEGEDTCLFNVSSIVPDEFGGVPNEAVTFTTNLSMDNFSSTQQDKILEAERLIKAVIASEEFKDAVFGYTYDGQKQFVENGGLTNAQIYERILEGAEKLTPARNNSMDAVLELYYEDTTTIGYTKPDTEKIFLNTKYFNSYTPAQVAGNLMHEWLHKLGFGHDSTYSMARASTVPYAIGYIMTRLAKTY